ncbi:MAG: tetratricopeptide repeat protein [Planctomycetes bacterium]|nr:tetratricopeptide repeat protein [Planctomycetota bacterium]
MSDAAREVRVRAALITHEREREEGRYERLEVLGRGGMAVVHRARDRKLGREVALKVLRDDLEITPEAVARFRREAQAAAQLSHPHIVTLLDAGEESGQLYLAMELVRGQPLSRALKEGRSGLRALVGLLEKVARAVEHAHERGIVHRDLKPDNVLVTPEGEPKVGDFGIAYLMRGGTALTRTGDVVGTPLYMAPEQLEGRFRAISPGTDVYALGAILYEMLTGRPPHEGATTLEVIGRILRLEPVTPRKLDRRIPVDLETICLKALEKEPRRRYRTARELADELGRWLAGEAIHARPTSFASKIARKVRRHRLIASLVALLGVVTLGGIFVTSVMRRSFQLSIEAREALEAARLALRDWEGQRYGKPHDITPWRHRLREAVIQLERALQRQPEASTVWGELGWACFELGDLDRARAALEEAVRREPTEGSHHYRLGRTWLRIYERERAFASRGRRERALEEVEACRRTADREFQTALAASTWESGKAWERDYVLAYASSRSGKRERARELCEDIARRHALGGEEALILLGEMEEAFVQKIAFLDRAVDLARSYAPAYAAAASARTRLGAALGLKGGVLDEIETALRTALDQAQTATQIDEDLPAGWSALGHARLNWADHRGKRGDDVSESYRRAVEEECARAILLEPHRAEPWWIRAAGLHEWASYRAGRGEASPDLFRRSIEDCDRAIEIEGECPEAYNSRGAAKADSGDPAGAIADYDRAIEIDRGYAEAYVNRGNALMKLGDAARAVTDYDLAIEISDVYAGAYNGRGAAKLALKDVAGAIADFDRAIQIKPEYAVAYNNRATARQQAGDPAGAVADCDCAIRINGAFAPAYYNRADARAAQGDLAGAIGDYTRAIEINPAHAEAYVNRGIVRTRRGELAAALSDYDRAIEMRPDLAQGYVNRGIAKMMQGDPAGAMADYDRAIELGANFPEVYVNRGLLREGRGDVEGAAADFETALGKASPNWPPRGKVEEFLKRVRR